MDKAMQVANRRRAKAYGNPFKEIDKHISLIFDFILEKLDENTTNNTFYGIHVFIEGTFDGHEYSIRKDGFYHFNENIIPFNIELDPVWMLKALKDLVEDHKYYFAQLEPYKQYIDEPLTYYLYINIK